MQQVLWDPNQQDTIFLCQSAALHASFYHAQICVHRDSLSSPQHTASSATDPHPSLAICKNAARACIHVLHVQHARTGTLSSQVLAPVHMPLFAACVVLVMDMWRERRAGRDVAPLAEDMRKGLEMLEGLER